MEEVTYKDLMSLNETLDKYSKVKGKEFAKAVFLNKDAIQKELKILQNFQRIPHPDYMNYENERMIICINYAEKDTNGNPIIENGPDGRQRYKIEDQMGFQIDFAELREKYKEVIDDMDNSQKEFDDFINQPSDVKLTKINLNSLPDEIDAQMIEELKFMINLE